MLPALILACQLGFVLINDDYVAMDKINSISKRIVYVNSENGYVRHNSTPEQVLQKLKECRDIQNETKIQQ